MIMDSVSNVDRYRGLSPRIARGLRLLANEELRRAEPGRHEVDGSSLYYLVQSYTTKPREQGAWESHRTYIDVQYVVEGAERCGLAAVGSLAVAKPYDPGADATQYSGTGDFLLLRAGTFVVLWPDDAHMPGIAVDAPARVRKIVIKILL